MQKRPQLRQIRNNYEHKAKSLSWNGPWVVTGAFPWRVGGNIFSLRVFCSMRVLRHPACHLFNSGTSSTQGLCLVCNINSRMDSKISKRYCTNPTKHFWRREKIIWEEKKSFGEEGLGKSASRAAGKRERRRRWWSDTQQSPTPALTRQKAEVVPLIWGRFHLKFTRKTQRQSTYPSRHGRRLMRMTQHGQSRYDCCCARPRDLLDSAWPPRFHSARLPRCYSARPPE